MEFNELVQKVQDITGIEYLLKTNEEIKEVIIELEKVVKDLENQLEQETELVKEEPIKDIYDHYGMNKNDFGEVN